MSIEVDRLLRDISVPIIHRVQICCSGRRSLLIPESNFTYSVFLKGLSLEHKSPPITAVLGLQSLR